MKKLEAISRIWDLCRPFRGWIIGILGFLLVQRLLGVFFPVITGATVTAITEHDGQRLALAVLGWAALASVQIGTIYLKERLEIQKLDYELSRHLARISMEKFFNISMGQHQLGHSIIRLSVISKGEAAINGAVSTAIYELLPVGLMVILPLIFLTTTVPVVGVVAIASALAFGAYTLYYNYRLMSRIRSLDTLANKITKKYGEIIQNADVVYINAQEERVREEYDEEKAKEGEEGRPLWATYITWFHGGQWFIALAQALCLGLGAYLAYQGQIKTGAFVTLSMWIFTSLGTLSNISHIQRNLAKNLAPIAKYFRFLDYEPDIVVPERPVKIEHLRGEIEFREVSFTYRSRTKTDDLNDDPEEAEVTTLEKKSEPEIPALRSVSFKLEAGKRYAFVGRSGAGKSTLVGLILRAHDPQTGHILVDGVDLRMLDYRELRHHIGLVPQDVALFDGTLRYNVTFGLNGSAASVTETGLAAVAKLARVAEFQEKLEQGWDTVIGERGIKLSGGQRQRVGIARALIKQPAILIFDEATSSLDTQNEALIRESIHEAGEGKTTVIIAHRLATVKDADKIFVLDEGRIVGEGTHDELLDSNSYYQNLVRSQVIMA